VVVEDDEEFVAQNRKDSDTTLLFDFNRVKDTIKGLLYDAKLVEHEEKGDLCELLNDSRLRQAVTEVLIEINTPKKIKSHDCLRMLADILRYILTLFVHEKNEYQIDFQLMSSILDSSGFVYIVENRRKTYLTYYMADHGMWTDILAWKECIMMNLNIRMQESNDRLLKRQ